MWASCQIHPNPSNIIKMDQAGFFHLRLSHCDAGPLKPSPAKTERSWAIARGSPRGSVGGATWRPQLRRGREQWDNSRAIEHWQLHNLGRYRKWCRRKICLGIFPPAKGSRAHSWTLGASGFWTWQFLLVTLAKVFVPWKCCILCCKTKRWLVLLLPKHI